jgi:hypothetical protein
MAKAAELELKTIPHLAVRELRPIEFGDATALIGREMCDNPSNVRVFAIHDKERRYFHSMYCRAPGGILVESCCDVPGGFEKDETREKLGTSLHLPPWFKDRWDEILAQLEPITVPETATAS